MSGTGARGRGAADLARDLARAPASPSGELLELRFHLGERERDGDRPLEAAVMDACARRGVAAAVTLRGIEGFGAKHRLRTDRLLSLSEDAPLVVVAVGEGEVIEGLAAEIAGMADAGLLVATPVVAGSGAGAPAPGEARPLAERGPARPASPAPAEDTVTATIWGPRSGPASPHLAAVAALRRAGADAATVLLGVDGVLGGERRRARFVAANRGVPAITVAFGPRAVIAAALADLPAPPSLVTVAPVERRWRYQPPSLHGGARIPADAASRLTFVTSEIAAHEGRRRYLALIEALRREGAAGATALRGVWGFRGDREPHGDRVLALRRDVPVIVEAVDTADRAGRWAELARAFAGPDDVVCPVAPQRTFTFG